MVSAVSEKLTGYWPTARLAALRVPVQVRGEALPAQVAGTSKLLFTVKVGCPAGGTEPLNATAAVSWTPAVPYTVVSAAGESVGAAGVMVSVPKPVATPKLLSAACVTWIVYVPPFKAGSGSDTEHVRDAPLIWHVAACTGLPLFTVKVTCPVGAVEPEELKVAESGADAAPYTTETDETATAGALVLTVSVPLPEAAA